MSSSMIEKKDMEYLIKKYEASFVERGKIVESSDDLDNSLLAKHTECDNAVNELAKKEHVTREEWDKAVEAQKAADSALLAAYNLRQQATIAAPPVQPSLEKKPEVASTNLVIPAPKPGEKILDVQKFYDQQFKTVPIDEKKPDGDKKYQEGYGTTKTNKGDTALTFPNEAKEKEFLNKCAENENLTSLMAKVDGEGKAKGYAFIHGSKVFEGNSVNDIIKNIKGGHKDDKVTCQAALSALQDKYGPLEDHLKKADPPLNVNSFTLEPLAALPTPLQPTGVGAILDKVRAASAAVNNAGGNPAAAATAATAAASAAVTNADGKPDDAADAAADTPDSATP